MNGRDKEGQRNRMKQKRTVKETATVEEAKRGSSTIKIGERLVGEGRPVFIIAEAGVNHNGSLELAKRLVDAAKDAGADAVKFQTFTAELLVTRSAEQAKYQAENTKKREPQFQMLKRLELPPAAYEELAAYAAEKKIIFLSTPFSEKDADTIESLVPAYKIPSGEITNIPFLRHVAQKEKPVLLSTGMASIQEVIQAAKAIRESGNGDIVVLHSTSNYPPSDESMNMRAITTLQRELRLPIGYSDNGHGTMDGSGSLAPVIAVTLGACVIEKHFTLDKAMEGPDQRASLSPTELQEMVAAVRRTERMLGSGEKKCTPEEEVIRAMARKSIITKRGIKKGETLAADCLIMKRPGTGISPTDLPRVLGKKAKRDIPQDTVLKWDDIA